MTGWYRRLWLAIVATLAALTLLAIACGDGGKPTAPTPTGALAPGTR